MAAPSRNGNALKAPATHTDRFSDGAGMILNGICVCRLTSAGLRYLWLRVAPGASDRVYVFVVEPSSDVTVTVAVPDDCVCTDTLPLLAAVPVINGTRVGFTPTE